MLMDKIGIICEYNPFHNGHIYHLEKIREMFPDSFITLVLSSSFTQRGEFSYLTKWDKTRIALEYKVDLVIELPFIFATQSADTFAYYGVSILEKLKMDYLIFGSETDDVDVLKNLVSTMLFNKEYDTLVKKYLDLGNNYPKSTMKALYNLTNIEINNSNDLLGLSYIKVIMQNNYQIKPLTIKRTNDYLAKEITSTITSATSIRENYLKRNNIDNTIPEITKEKLKMDYNYLDNYYYLLKYKLISEIDTLDKYLDVVEGIDIRIKKFILVSNTYQELIENIKTKRFTYNKLNRMFLHILFNIKKDQKYDINYIRVLGFNLKGRLYLKTIKDDLDTLIITNYKDIDDEVLKIERRITILYLQIIKREDLIKEELKSIPIKIN